MASPIFQPWIFPADIKYFPQGLTKGIRARIGDFLTPVKSHHGGLVPAQLNSASPGMPGAYHPLNKELLSPDHGPGSVPHGTILTKSLEGSAQTPFSPT